ncbi:putative pyruvate formate lyase activating enzyme [Ruminiclostridium sufflavum DSM 19573]|uniref:Putative pyruvate formate lyase activating enzyme n=1 Tax=Ruminiclostridium sufflavum DSM 19573 TaxID=1121337 RepID=A0A318XSB1_9FIRM|nr:radical SAM protein [Ruminiclostridium sufflavum]PYG89131.1 putative pyruvate formate lyase activating enzyme [Ruminiclostridium sufflavum DSM 19573]
MSKICKQCPRQCGVDREDNIGFCGMQEQLKVAKAFLHMWEEPCISGTNGSGAVFFSGCNLKCIYCQNFDISQNNYGKIITVERLQKIFAELMGKGAHNINLVNPSHYTGAIKQALLSAKRKGILNVPVVYNTNGYESIDSLEEMEGLVDVYLPDFKYFSGDTAFNYSSAYDYPDICKKAILEMFRQVGSPVLSSDGLISRGLIIRHLILPGHTKESTRILDWISENLPKGVYVSLMSQYTPYYGADKHPEINRPITRREYESVVNHLYKSGMEEGYVQERQSSDIKYIPDFNLEGV